MELMQFCVLYNDVDGNRRSAMSCCLAISEAKNSLLLDLNSMRVCDREPHQSNVFVSAKCMHIATSHSEVKQNIRIHLNM